MHVIDVDIAPEGTDPEAHDQAVRERVVAACEEHGEVELRYPDSEPDVAQLVDGVLVVVAK